MFDKLTALPNQIMTHWYFIVVIAGVWYVVDMLFGFFPRSDLVRYLQMGVKMSSTMILWDMKF